MVVPGQKIQSARAGQAVACAVLFSIATYVVVGVVLVKEGGMDPIIPARELSPVGLVLILLSVAAAGASFLIRMALGARVRSENATLSDRFRITLISMAVAESSGVFGLVYAILAQELSVAFVLWGVSLAAGIAHFPTRGWLEGPARK